MRPPIVCSSGTWTCLYPSLSFIATLLFVATFLTLKVRGDVLKRAIDPVVSIFPILKANLESN